jgi:hypothetical protein
MDRTKNEKLIVVDKEVRVRCPQTGEEWVLTSIWNCPTVVLESWGGYQEVKRFDDFMEFFKYCFEVGIRNADAYLNWRKKPAVWVNNVTALSHLCLMERNFKWFEARVEYIPHPEWSMEYLRKELPADDFAELCMDKGWKIF